MSDPNSNCKKLRIISLCFSKQDHYDSHSSAYSTSHNHDAIPKISESEVSDSFSESDYYDSGYENRH